MVLSVDVTNLRVTDLHEMKNPEAPISSAIVGDHIVMVCTKHQSRSEHAFAGTGVRIAERRQMLPVLLDL